jgi:hypothetical protein
MKEIPVADIETHVGHLSTRITRKAQDVSRPERGDVDLYRNPDSELVSADPRQMNAVMGIGVADQS